MLPDFHLHVAALLRFPQSVLVPTGSSKVVSVTGSASSANPRHRPQRFGLIFSFPDKYTSDIKLSATKAPIMLKDQAKELARRSVKKGHVQVYSIPLNSASLSSERSSTECNFDKMLKTVDGLCNDT